MGPGLLVPLRSGTHQLPGWPCSWGPRPSMGGLRGPLWVSLSLASLSTGPGGWRVLAMSVQRAGLPGSPRRGDRWPWQCPLWSSPAHTGRAAGRAGGPTVHQEGRKNQALQVQGARRRGGRQGLNVLWLQQTLRLHVNGATLALEAHLADARWRCGEGKRLAEGRRVSEGRNRT